MTTKVCHFNFKTATADEWGEAFGLIALVPGTTAYEYVDDQGRVYAIGYTYEADENGSWVCQIDDAEGGNLACWDGQTPEEALERACVEACAADAMRENPNCEDATNCMGADAFEMLNGGLLPAFDGDYVEFDRLLGYASDVVKRRGESYGIEWEPYQAYEA